MKKQYSARVPSSTAQKRIYKQPLKIVAEVTRWEGHSPEVLDNMLENLKKLSASGIKAID